MIKRIERSDVALSDLFSQCVKTGTFCRYEPNAGSPISWEFAALTSGEREKLIWRLAFDLSRD